MRRALTIVLILACLAGLVLACYGPVLTRGEQFAYRDAAHFYYPLYQRVQQEWDAGRWPLWEPEENAGMPLLGNPTAAVLYPGKLIYAALPYPWAARVYVVAHTLLAFVGMLALLRSWEISATGSALGALGYAFGAPILFQYCNVIFLVGAAWYPLAFRAIDRLVRLGRQWAAAELAVVLAMQTLGGDPQAAYLAVLCGGGYAVGLAWAEQRDRRPVRAGRAIALGVLALGIWVAGVLGAARWFALKGVEADQALRALPWLPSGQSLLVLGWGLAGLVVLGRCWRQDRKAVLARRLVALAGSALLALGLTGAQLLPVVEFTRQSLRAAGREGPHDIYPFSLEPCRALELLWPNLYGSGFHGNRYWLPLVPPAHVPQTWTPSLYLGGLTLILALAAAGARGGPPWRAWMTAVAGLSLLASFGKYESPLWWARTVPGMQRCLGAHDPELGQDPRVDGSLSDGAGSVYGLLTAVLPWFRTFRYPSKILTLTAMALAALAGMGWDRLRDGRRGRAAGLAAGMLALSAVALGAAALQRKALIRMLEASSLPKIGSLFGPFEPAGAVNDLLAVLAQGAVVMALGLVIILLAGRRPRLAGALALLVTTADLARANAELVVTVPQAEFETEPRVLQLIEEAEKADPSPGPFRVHRMPLWHPLGWLQARSPDRARELVRWERDTLQPKYGLPWRLSYTMTEGTTELYDYMWFFGPFRWPMDARGARILGVSPGQEVVYHPRRGFDLWNTRYFIVPVHPGGWNDEMRSYAAFMFNTEPVFPKFGKLERPEEQERYKQWAWTQDWLILKNRSAYPRAWVVHRLRSLRPISGLTKEQRQLPLQTMLFLNDPIWSSTSRVYYEMREEAWVETDDFGPIEGFNVGGPPGRGDSVRITRYEPQRVELTATLERPGMVVLADVFYPGWKLTIDGVAKPIWRANRMMRGAAVPSGTHRLVYTYEPASFRLGAAVSIASLAALAALAGWAWRRPLARGPLATMDLRLDTYSPSSAMV